VNCTARQVTTLGHDDQPDAAILVATHEGVVAALAATGCVLEAGSLQRRDELPR
jgi:hypothetical protein